MNKYIVLIFLTLPGLLLSLLAFIFFWVLFPGIIHSQVEQQIRLVEGSDTWNKWRDAPVPIYLTFYIYHVTNPDEVENGLQAKLEEKGPYVYRQKRVKVDIKQENGQNTVKYREVKTYYFDQEKSGENREDDLINILNIPFVGLIHGILKMLPLDLIAGIIGNIILLGEPLIKRDVKVRELLFEGFDVTKYTDSLLGRQLPKEFSGGRFGLYKGKNGTASELWEVYTGVESSPDFGKLKSWDEKPDLGFWRKYSDCDKLKGTDGAIFPPFLTKTSRPQAFSPDVCRSIYLEYSEDVEHFGIPGYRFIAPKGNFDDPRVSEATRCYCLEDELEKCHYAGVQPLESCTQAPIWISLPHFLNSDIRYLADAGLDPPEREKHQTFLDFEPLTGLVLRAHKRLQINLEVKYNRRVRSLQHLTKDKVLFPIIWADESAEVDEKLANELKNLLFTPVEIAGVVKWVAVVFGVVLIIAGVYVSIQRYNLLGNTAFNGNKKNPEIKPKSSTSAQLSSSRGKRGSSKVVAEESQGKRDNSSTASNVSISYIDSSQIN